MTKKDDRLFAPFSIELDEHPKFVGLSDAAFRAFFEAVFYSRRRLTDGFLDERVVLRRWGVEVAAELTSNDPERPSWVRVDNGWRIHDFELHHPLRAYIEEKRAAISAKRSEAGKQGAAKRWQKDGKGQASDSSETETETTTPKGVVRASRRKPLTRLPDDWTPKPSHVQYARDRGVDGRHEEGQFRAHAAANDRMQRDWDAAFRGWLGNARPGKPSPTERAQRTVLLATELLEVES